MEDSEAKNEVMSVSLGGKIKSKLRGPGKSVITANKKKTMKGGREEEGGRETGKRERRQRRQKDKCKRQGKRGGEWKERISET